jgi:hypothetical protein
LRDDVGVKGKTARQHQDHFQPRTCPTAWFLPDGNPRVKTPKWVAGESDTVAKHNVSGGAALKTPAGLTVLTAL